MGSDHLLPSIQFAPNCPKPSHFADACLWSLTILTMVSLAVLFGGLIGSWFSLLQYISQPIVGSLSDIYGRKPLLLICLTGICSSYFFWSLSSQMFSIFIISRTIGGLSKGNISLSTAIVTDVSDESNRGKGMALIGISFSIGFIVWMTFHSSGINRSATRHRLGPCWEPGSLFSAALAVSTTSSSYGRLCWPLACLWLIYSWCGAFSENRFLLSKGWGYRSTFRFQWRLPPHLRLDRWAPV